MTVRRAAQSLGALALGALLAGSAIVAVPATEPAFAATGDDAPVPAVELTIKNYSFEAGNTSPWKQGRGGKVNFAAKTQTSSIPAPDGRRFMATSTFKPSGSFNQDLTHSSLVGDTFTVSALMRSGHSSRTIRGQLAIAGIGGSNESVRKKFEVGQDWTEVSATITMKKSAHPKLRLAVYLDTGHRSLLTDNVTVTSVPVPRKPFNMTARSLSAASSGWVVVNKLRPLVPKTYVPTGLVTAKVRYYSNATMRFGAASALEKMFAAAKKEGAGDMMVDNAYRSYHLQVSVYQGHVNRLGQKQADIASARAGHSEHQTGLTADIAPYPRTCAVQECFADTKQGKWLAKNAWRYGYLLRYPKGKTGITGFAFEPWHYRYIGIDLATEMHDRGIKTLEEFFGLPAAPTYR